MFYRQFSITMAVVDRALRRRRADAHAGAVRDVLKRPHTGAQADRWRCSTAFDRGYARTEAATRRLARAIAGAARRHVRCSSLASSPAASLIAAQVPRGLHPERGPGHVLRAIKTPPGATLERTNEVVDELQAIARKLDGVETVASLAGYEVLTEGRGSNDGTVLINLKPWAERSRVGRARSSRSCEARSAGHPGAQRRVLRAAAVPGYGAAGGFALRLLDKTGRRRLQPSVEA